MMLDAFLPCPMSEKQQVLKVEYIYRVSCFLWGWRVMPYRVFSRVLPSFGSHWPQSPLTSLHELINFHWSVLQWSANLYWVLLTRSRILTVHLAKKPLSCWEQCWNAYWGKKVKRIPTGMWETACIQAGLRSISGILVLCILCTTALVVY